MTVADITPSAPAEYEDRPGITIVRAESTAAPLHRYTVRVPRPAPPSLRVTLQLGQEEAGVWARIIELDVAGEGETLREALEDVLRAARDWLEYLRDEAPELGEDLRDQERFVPLLDAPVFSWFRAFRFE
jgi:hypothetical protein